MEADVMGAMPNPTGSSSVFTSHGTMVFVEKYSGQLQHGKMENNPQNAVFIKEGDRGQFFCLEGGARYDALSLPDHSRFNSGSNLIELNSAVGGQFTIVGTTDTEFGLKMNGLFLCAEPDGRITLSRTECKSWELFHFRNDASEITGTVVSHRIDGRIIRFFISNRSDYIQSCLLRGDFYDRDALNIIKNEIRNDNIFLDVGANIGNHCIFLSKFCDIKEIIAIEPNPDAFSILKINILLNECRNVNTDHLGVALASRPGKMRVSYPSSGNIGGAQLIPDEFGTVDCVTGDEIIRERSIGFIKIDVEGSEFDVLEGLRQTISVCRPSILIEVWKSGQSNLESWCRNNNYIIRHRLLMDDNFLLVPKED
ncbi:FkbM family methyltransferase [Mesorhizobium sp. CU2]|uniref:FkbM family methyltransferase n=1 Tax=unclassified Mesorhizobium TaxID=325217 RepID=UPI00112A392C|nr:MULTISPECIES: FkbM family methyltransferase [unclassified Mesorhizobium]TPN80424.1 FkbM family methyltransferase [Mesorhizobium sp. CU3]TPO10578.1 FkbM family methyltransferase [Mesorhizobium sp. CU2]